MYAFAQEFCKGVPPSAGHTQVFGGGGGATWAIAGMPRGESKMLSDGPSKNAGRNTWCVTECTSISAIQLLHVLGLKGY